jgi:hypothetical protein
MRTRSAALVLAVALMVPLGLAGCGVPSSGSPSVVGAAPAAGDPVNQAGTVRLPVRDGATTALELAERFFQAGAAADWDPDRDEDTRIDVAKRHAEQFLKPELRGTWPVGNEILVADATFTESLDSVTVRFVPIGVLEATGEVGPLRQGEAKEMVVRFQAETVNGTLLLSLAQGSSMPSNVILSLDGLRTLFEDRAVYFLDKTNRYVVPDRRYVNRGMSEEKRIRAIIKQWLAGPSEVLKKFVAPQTVLTQDNPSLDGNRVTVNLLPGAQEPNQNDALRRIAAQIRWSVHRGSSAPDVEIQVNSRKQYEDTGTGFLEFNPSQPRTDQGTPDEHRLFAVQAGRVVAVSPLAPSPSILLQPENSDVILAAVQRSNNDAALVRQLAGRLELWLGGGGTESAYVKAMFPGTPQTMSRPSFMPGTGRVLVAVDGTLCDVALTGGVQPVTVPSAWGRVTAVSVAPDGARVALVVDGRAVAAPLDPTAAVASIGEPRVLSTPGVSQAHGIGWLYDDRVVVGGASAMVEVAIDNGRIDPFAPANLAGSQLTQVSAVPGNPFDGTRGSVVVEAGNPQQAYFAYASGLVPIVPLGVPSPSASASAGTGGNSAAPKMSAPFYVDDVK